MRRVDINQHRLGHRLITTDDRHWPVGTVVALVRASTERRERKDSQRRPQWRGGCVCAAPAERPWDARWCLPDQFEELP